MGCDISSTEAQAPKSTLLIRALNDQQKERISKLIQSDDIIGLAICMEEIGVSPQFEVSDSGMQWMLHHLCCRWDAEKCLEYVLKEFFSLNPRKYVEFVNSKTAEGASCLHLCAIWNAEHCFEVLIYYGGLNLAAVEQKMERTALQLASEYKNKKMAEVLNKYELINVNFTHIEAEKLISSENLFEKSTQSSHHKIEDPKMDANLANLTANLADYTQEKKKMEEKKARIIQEKMDLEKKMADQRRENAEKKRVEREKKKKEEEEKRAAEYQRKKKQLEEEKKKNAQEADEFMNAFEVDLSEAGEEELEEQEESQSQSEYEEERKRLQEALMAQQVEMKRVQEQEQRLKEEERKRKEEEENKRVAEQIAKAEAEKAQREAEKKVMLEKAKLQYQEKEKQRLEKERVEKEERQKRAAAAGDSNTSSLPANIQRAYEEAKRAGIFVDKEFPAVNSTMGPSSKPNYGKVTNNTAWYRPAEIFKGDYKLFDGIDPNDIKQGSLGVCYMLATISALASNPKNIEAIFVFHDLKLGFYVLRLYKNGIPIHLLLDDQIPCNKTTKSPIFAKPIGNQLWVLLLEKAWAKMVGNYLDAEAMTPDHMMEDLSGAPGYGEWFKDDKAKLEKVAKHSDLNHLIVVTSTDKKVEGIASNHAYSILGAYRHDGGLIFKVRNPWGYFEWSGDYGASSSKWTAALKAQLKFQDKNDGIFFISEKEMFQIFIYYSISQIFPNYCYSFIEFKSQKFQSLYFKFSTSKAGNTNLRVTQPFKRMVRDTDYSESPMTFEIGKVSGHEVKFLSEGASRTYWGAKSVHFTDQIYSNLQAGEYFVHLRMIWKDPSKYNSGVLAAYAQENIALNRLDDATGEDLVKKMYFSQALAKNRVPSGEGFYKISTMKGQFVFVAETDGEGPHKATFKFNTSQMQKAELSLGKMTEETLEVRLSKGNPGIGTALRTDPSKGGTTGSVSITIKKA